MDTSEFKSDKLAPVQTTPGNDRAEGTVISIDIDPAREAAVRRKFDIYVVPVSVIYLVLSTLDRNNVSGVFRRPERHTI